MTPEEIQNTIEQMLGVQRQIQESQIRNTDNIARLESQIQANAQYIQENAELIRNNREDISSLKEDISNLVVEVAKLTVDQREKFNQFYGYHLSADSQRLDIVERLIKVEQEVAQIKRQLGQSS
ncbi:hypothetical protein [Rivularia sp. UHCC 0363]|uniref:hypothetical protein n=1 Tax=Rivularia sp. UHCC 0363 TaxID=3110244 RepID=UPI002B20C1D8|nr:hypothetical protein [Rivularia sp. UHCC 0363]MEA5595280.1 hypothetical protein [Rivularia sp. UHCC 0363]